MMVNNVFDYKTPSFSNKTLLVVDFVFVVVVVVVAVFFFAICKCQAALSSRLTRSLEYAARGRNTKVYKLSLHFSYGKNFPPQSKRNFRWRKIFENLTFFRNPNLKRWFFILLAKKAKMWIIQRFNRFNWTWIWKQLNHKQLNLKLYNWINFTCLVF